MTPPPLTAALRETLALFEGSKTPRTTTEVAERLDLGRRSTYERLNRLVERGELETKKVGANGRVWWRPTRFITDEAGVPAEAESGDTERLAGVRGERAEPDTRDRERGRYERLIDAAGDPMYELDATGRFTYVNRAFVEMIGYERDELLGRHVSKMMSEEAIANVESLIKDLLAADSGESATLEYEVETEDGRRIPVENHLTVLVDDDGDFYGSAGILRDVSDRVEARRALKHQREQLAALSHINTIVHEITDAVLKQSTREEIEQTVCDSLSGVGGYAFAWIGEVDPATRTVTKRAEAGVDGYLDEITISVDPDDERSRGPAGRALLTGTIQTSKDVYTDDRNDPWREQIREYDYRSTAAIPIVHENTVYGVLKVYAERSGAFEEPERAVIGQLGEVVGHAIVAVERKWALMSDELVELEFHVPDGLEAMGIEATAEGQIAFDTVVATSDSDYLVYGTMDPDARETLATIVEQYDPWRSMAVLSGGSDTVRFQIRSSELSLRSAIASAGGSVERAVLDDGGLHIRVQFPPSGDASSITEVVTETYPSARVLAKRQSPRSQHVTNRTALEALTDRQRAVLEVAYIRGYFEWPRETSGDDLATALGVAPSTFSQHLRKAEKSVFEAVFEQ